MRELTETALNAATRRGVDYADVRIVERRENVLRVQRRSLKHMEDEETVGYAVRVLKDGAWGLASDTALEEDRISGAAERAVEVAEASARVPAEQPARMVAEPAHEESCTAPYDEDPFEVPASEKADVLLSACSTMMDVDGIAMAWGRLEFIRLRRIIANTDGTYLDLTNLFTNPALEATAVTGGDSQNRGYQGGARQAGFEFVRQIDLPSNAERWAKEAVTKTEADECPEGTMDLVLDPDHLALTMHESVGHPTESDRVLGWEANMAGRSFVSPSDVGSLKYAADQVTFTANNRLHGGVGSWFYDDDGVLMQKFPIIRDGVLQNLSTTRETAALLGHERSNGCSRASGFSRFPINRIPNLYMEPGVRTDSDPEDLVADVERGIYIHGQGSFSIDQMRRNFQFGGDMFWLIEDGEITKPLKHVTYQARTTDFWKSCDGIAGPAHWKPHGVMNCGKGEPMQVMFMTHGASHARFRDIEVGGASR